MTDTFKIFVNESVSAALAAVRPAERKKIEQKLSFLSAGIWNGGLVVKKLAGCSRKVVFEGRISGGDRMLFTLGRQDGTAAVYLWAIVSHDDVDRGARRIKIQDAPFLDFTPAATEEIEDLYLDAVPSGWDTQESLEQKVEADYGPQKWHSLEELDWRRLEAAGKDEIFFHLSLTREQEAVLDRPSPLLLSGTAGSGKTTLAIYYLLRKEYLGKPRLFVTYSPYLRDYADRLYRGLIRNSPLADRPPQPDFLTIEELERLDLAAGAPIADRAKAVDFRDFAALMAGNEMARRFDPELVWEEIRAIIKGAKPAIPVRRFQESAQRLASGGLSVRERQELATDIAGLSRFTFAEKLRKIVSGNGGHDDLDAFANAFGTGAQPDEGRIVAAIAEIVKKKAESINETMLSLEEYRHLGAKRAPHFPYDRDAIHSLAVYYQRQLEANGLHDEVDLARAALACRRRSADRPVWDLVASDEIQDFTELQTELLFDCAADRSHIFLAGDDRQIINPSGFRWEEIRQRFYEAGATVPDVYRLSLNFRSVGSIVNLANALLALKKRLIGVTKYESAENWKYAGKPPVVIAELDEDRVAGLLANRGADSIVLVRSPDEQTRLKRRLRTELVFTIHEAKGLEFETILLWKFAEDPAAAALWRKIEHGEKLTEDHEPHLRYEINLLYVAVTRARRNLVVYDGPEPSPVWKTDALAPFIVVADNDVFLAECWSEASAPEDWENQGDNFMERRYFAAAAECYKNAGSEEKRTGAEAEIAYEKRRYPEAAVLFEQLRRYAKAAEAYERADDFPKAIELYRKSGEKLAAERLAVLSLEQTGRLAEAGKRRMKLGEFQTALKDWESGKEYRLLAAYYKGQKDKVAAARWFEKAGDYDKAFGLRKALGHVAEAAELALKLGNTDAALAYAKKHVSSAKYLEFCRKTGDGRIIGYAQLENGKIDEALRSFQQYGQKAEENRRRLAEEAAANFKKRTATITAAVLYESLGKFHEAAAAYRKLYQYDRAAANYEQAGEFQEAAVCYGKIGNTTKAQKVWDNYMPTDFSGRINKIVAVGAIIRGLVFRPTQKGESDNYDRDQADRAFSEGLACMERRDYCGAIARFEIFSNTEKLLAGLIELRDDDLAAWVLTGRNNLELWSEYRVRRNTLKFDCPRVCAFLKDRFNHFDFDQKCTNEYVRGVLRFLSDLLAAADESYRETAASIIKRNLKNFMQYSSYRILQYPSEYDHLIRLSVSVGCYFNLSMAIIYSSAPKENLKYKPLFLDRLRAYAAETNDLTIWMILVNYGDQMENPAIFQNARINADNWQIAVELPQLYQEAIAYLLQAGNINAAVGACRYHRDFDQAIALLLEAGDYKEAGSIYEERGQWPEAAALYESYNDQVQLARLYDHKGDYDRSLAIWEQLGDTKNAARMRKKREKNHPKQGILDL